MDLHAEDITTDRLALRLLQPSDAGWIAREIANPKVHRWLTHVPKPYSLADAHEFIAERLSNVGLRVIEAEGDPSGVVGIAQPRDSEADPQLGYWLKEAAWGNGIMSDAATALVRWHQATFKRRLQSGWIEGNAASEKILRKIGFQDHEIVQEHAFFHGGPVTVHRVRLDTP